VLETALGFHILLRRTPPPQEEVDAQRVVIRYAGTLSSIDESSSDRSRVDALNLANTIATSAREGALPFATLVSQYSEHADRDCEGDIGVWSTTEPGDKPREIETVSRLKIGEVAAPMDSLWGFQVLRRVEPNRHSRFAMSLIRFKFGPTLTPEDPRSRPSVYAEASSLAQKLRHDPSGFDEARAQHNDAAVEAWERGHGPPQVTLALDRLHIGEIAAEPIAIPFYFVIPKRLDPVLTGIMDLPFSYELPLRATPDLRQLFHDSDSTKLAARIAEFMRPEVEAGLGLAEQEKVVLRSILKTLQTDVQGADGADARVRSYDAAIKRLHESLSEAVFSRMMAFFEQESARIILANP
jgi:hypothetical protein